MYKYVYMLFMDKLLTLKYVHQNEYLFRKEVEPTTFVGPTCKSKTLDPI